MSSPSAAPITTPLIILAAITLVALILMPNPDQIPGEWRAAYRSFMASPSKILSPLSYVWPGLGKTIDKAFEGPTQPAAPVINIPAPPGLTPAQQPTSKPARKSMQQSFLSGAAAGALPGAGGATGGQSQGKTLLGQ